MARMLDKECTLCHTGPEWLTQVCVEQSHHAAQMWSPAKLSFRTAVVPDKRLINDMPDCHGKHLRAGLLW